MKIILPHIRTGTTALGVLLLSSFLLASATLVHAKQQQPASPDADFHVQAKATDNRINKSNSDFLLPTAHVDSFSVPVSAAIQDDSVEEDRHLTSIKCPKPQQYSFYQSKDSKGNDIGRAPTCKYQAWANIRGAFVQIDSNKYNQAVAVSKKEAIYYYNGKKWSGVSGGLVHVSIGTDGSFWGSNRHQSVFRRTSFKAKSWVWMRKKLVQVDALNYKEAVGIDPQGKAWYFNGKGWIELPGPKLKMISIGHRDRSAWAVDHKGVIYRRQNVADKKYKWQVVSGLLTYVDASSYEYAIGNNKSRHIWFYNKNKWARLSGSAQTSSLSVDGSVFVTSPGGKNTWRRQVALCNFNQRIASIADACNKNANCGGFTSTGILKSSIANKNKLMTLSNKRKNKNVCDGIFAKKDCSAQENLKGYAFDKGWDSPGYNIRRVKGKNFKQLADICNRDYGCWGFNTNGYLKYDYATEDDGWEQPKTFNQCDGFFSKLEADCENDQLDDYGLYPRFDSPSKTIKRVTGSLEKIAEACDGMDDCEGFNSKGELKTNIPDDSGLKFRPDFKVCEGLYVY